jgi:hypothetical protein
VLIMKACRRASLLSLILTIGLVSECESIRGQQSPQGLIQATFAAKTDSQGFRWDIGRNGNIQSGTNGSLASALTLTINNSSFSSSQRMMTANGDEYIVSGNVQGLNVTRRIKIDLKNATARYVEVFNNPTAASVAASVILVTFMANAPLQSVITDSGKPFSSAGVNPLATAAGFPAGILGGLPAGMSPSLITGIPPTSSQLGPKDEGLIGMAMAGVGQVSCLFYLAETKSKVRPTIVNDSNFLLQFTYSITVPAGKTVAIMHGVAQRNLNTLPDSKAAAELFKPFRSRAWAADLPADIRGSLLNLGSGSGFGTGGDEISFTSLETLGVEQGAEDIVADGDRTRLRGVATCGRILVKTRFGAYAVPFDKVAAILGEQSSRGNSRVFLRDGQVLCGPLELIDLRFSMITGEEIHLTGDRLDRLVMHKDAQDGQPADNVFALLETSSGDRLALVGKQSSPLIATTPWGERSIPLDEILRVSADLEQIGQRLKLKDGSQLFALLAGPAMSIQTQIFGVQKFDSRQLRSLIATHMKTSEVKQQSEFLVPYLVLTGENLFIGRVDQSIVHFLISGQRVPVASNQIRVMRNITDKGEMIRVPAGKFEAELWDGSNINGLLEELVLPVRLADRVFSVRVQDIEEVHVPTPTVPEAVRVKIARLLQDLGDPDFARREAASKSLAESGYLAKPQLNEVLSRTTDPEVRRRVQKLLNDLRD